MLFFIKMLQEVACCVFIDSRVCQEENYLHCKEAYLLGCVCVFNITTSEKRQLHDSLYMGPPLHNKCAHKPALSEEVLVVGLLIV